jgi:predicted ATPase/class 3 adenylate cyclase
VEARLPTGTLTFLFTDVEGSTRALAEQGAERYAEALREHHGLIRDAVAAHGGIEVDTQGDAFFCVFTSARKAVACAEQAQASLATTEIRVRMGLHSGEALVVEDHYVGMDVHRAARVAAAGHGGQVLLSPTTVPLLEQGSFALHDLGEHRLKDLSAPLRLYQLGETQFPPLKTLHRTNLPVPSTPFLGRRREVETILDAVTSDSTRLLTLTGPGGTGKTRLALQIAAESADEFPGGVFWVPLAPIREASLVSSAVANALGVEEEGGTDIARLIGGSIAAQTLLLVDNCEHVLDDAAAVISSLLASTADLRVIATSREALSLAGERVVPVDPLVRSDAVNLFCARAEAAGADGLDQQAVEMLCERLDDLPLAIELAAARAPTIPPPLLLERLSQRLDLLRGPRDADVRQRTLGATIAWSYDLLTSEEQRLLRRTSLFAGGATIEALEEITDADIEELASLVAKSLVRMTPTANGPRYWMLETIREFAGEQLAATDELGPLRQAYLRWFVDLVIESGARGPDPLDSIWLERLETELGNLRVAFQLAIESDDDAVVALGTSLGELHALRGRAGEAYEALSEATERVEEPLAASKLQRLLGRVYVRRDDLEAAATAYAHAEELLDAPDEAESWWSEWLEVKLAQAHHLYWIGDNVGLQRAAKDLRPFVERRGTARQQHDFLHVLYQTNLRQEQYVLSERTEELARAVYTAAEAAGEWDGEFHLGFGLLWRGKLEEAEKHLWRALDEARRLGDVLTETRCLVYGSIARRKLGDVDGVQELDAELAKMDDTYSYAGLIAANRAWLSWRARDGDATQRWGTKALEAWERVGRAGPTVFQWSARFPMLAVDVGREQIESAAAHARFMLGEAQQPLPADVRSALEEAVRAQTAKAFERAIVVARTDGYT